MELGRSGRESAGGCRVIVVLRAGGASEIWSFRHRLQVLGVGGTRQLDPPGAKWHSCSSIQIELRIYNQRWLAFDSTAFQLSA